MSSGSNGTVGAPRDRTARAVATQVRAMGCTSYEIGVLDAAQGLMLLRTWTVAELEHGIAWLKRVNAHGHDIYIRPAGSVGLILLDDLDQAAIARLTHDGLQPAVVVETSPGNYQAWLRVAEQPIAPEQATMVARILVERYGGDPASADWRHFGRLAGFTNRKPKHRQESGMQPFVLVQQAAGVATEWGAQLLEEAATRHHNGYSNSIEQIIGEVSCEPTDLLASSKLNLLFRIPSSFIKPIKKPAWHMYIPSGEA